MENRVSHLIKDQANDKALKHYYMIQVIKNWGTITERNKEDIVDQCVKQIHIFFNKDKEALLQWRQALSHCLELVEELIIEIDDIVQKLNKNSAEYKKMLKLGIEYVEVKDKLKERILQIDYKLSKEK